VFCDDVDRPLMTWPDATDSGRPVSVVRWCRSRPSVFFVLDSESHLYIWDLNMDESSALKRELITQHSRSLLQFLLFVSLSLNVVLSTGAVLGRQNTSSEQLTQGLNYNFQVGELFSSPGPRSFPGPMFQQRALKLSVID